MLLTKECDYGVRIIRALADGTKKTVEIITKEENIPHRFAYKIIKKLEQAGYVNSVRGRSGGYYLAKPLNTFNLIDVVTAVDANRYINECLRPGADCELKEKPGRICAVHIELARIQEVLTSEFCAKTMAEVLLREDDTDV